MKTWELLSGRLPDITDVEYSKQLREIDFGQLAGKPKEELMPTILEHKADHSLNYPGGESGGIFIKRVVDYIENRIAENIDRTLLFVTHFGVMETAVNHFVADSEQQSVSFDASRILVFTFEGARFASMEAY